MPRNRMFLQDVKSVGFVDYGACGGDTGKGGADIVLFKRAKGDAKKDAMSFDDMQQQHANGQVMSELWRSLNQFDDAVRSILQSDEENKQAAVDESLSQFIAFLESAVPQWAAGETVTKGGVMPQAKDKPVDLEKLDGKDLLEAAKKLATDVATLTAEKATADAEVEKLKADAEKAKGDAEPTEDDVLKSADPAVVALIEKQRRDTEAAQKRADEAVALANAETEKRETAEYVQKAKAYGGLPGEDAELGAILRKAKAAFDDDEYEGLEKRLRAGSDAIEKGFAEIGNGNTPPENSAQAEVEKRAEKMVADGKADNLTAAKVAVRQADRDLQERERAELKGE